MKIASINIGTNTCNIIIAESDSENNADIIYTDKRPVKLIDDQYFNDNISENAINRTITTLLEYKKIIKKHKVQKNIVIATSGIRNANNRDYILERIISETNFSVKVIDGLEEAEIVYKAVRRAVNLDEKSVLVIDIGGGSVEFIICNNSEVLWMDSYNIGIARLLKKYDFDDPLINENIIFLKKIFTEKFNSVISEAIKYEVNTLIGSSGSFDTFKNLSICSTATHIPEKDRTYYEIPLDVFDEIHQNLINTNLFERIEIKGMDPIRVEMMPIASVLIKFLIEKLKIEKFIQSGYTIKEGLIFDYLSD